MELEVLASPEEAAAPDGGDDCLLEGLIEGAEWAYEALIAQYGQPVYNLVCRLVWDQAEACDVVQEVFIKVFRKIGAFRGDSSLRTWIYRIAVNEARNHCRWHGRHRGHEVGLERDAESRNCPATLAADGLSPFDLALEREQQHLVEQALAELSPAFRSVVVLRDVEELSYEEIAGILGLPLGTVKSRILRGREALRKLLQQKLEPAPRLHLSPQLVE
ncbi:MAG: sigma-70 family RNA polymerase sigma factor [Bryobacterales bacterium]|nr:sigma-70 family RNA polymerase sigma factor [Bryobacterales bacterium]